MKYLILLFMLCSLSLSSQTDTMITMTLSEYRALVNSPIIETHSQEVAHSSLAAGLDALSKVSGLLSNITEDKGPNPKRLMKAEKFRDKELAKAKKQCDRGKRSIESYELYKRNLLDIKVDPGD